MRSRLLNCWLAINNSYWFVPSAMVATAIILGVFMVWLDTYLGVEWLSAQVGWFQSIKPSGARSVLSSIAGTMITVAATVFSITIAAITFASGQFGPRLLTNFMSDRGNTVTLGTLVGTSVYCLIVLRTIREEVDGVGFVPQLAVIIGLLLAFCSIAVLIYFINHVPRAIHINTVIAGIGQQLLKSVDERFPTRLGSPADASHEHTDPQRLLLDRLSNAQALPSLDSGYIQSIEERDLLNLAAEHDLLLRLRYRPGDFVANGRPLLDAWSTAIIDEEVCAKLRSAFVIGNERTPYGDLNFLIEELVEVAVRALSPGVNDPITARTCMDWLGAGLSALAGRSLPDPARLGDDGQVRLIAFPDSFDQFVHLGLGQLRQYAAPDFLTAIHMLRTIGIVAPSCADDEQIRSLEDERQRLTELARAKLTGPSLRSFDRLSRELGELLALGAGCIDERDVKWLGGKA